MRGIVAAAAVWAAFATPASARTAFLPTLDDVPAAPGMSVVAPSGLVFEAPEGRVLIVETRGGTSVRAVLDWYRETMPALGWSVRSASGAPAGVLQLVRGRERLEIEAALDPAAVSAAGGVTTRFRLVAPGQPVSP